MKKCDCGYDATYIVNDDTAMCMNCLFNAISNFAVVQAEMFKKNDENKELIDKMRQLGVMDNNV